MRIIPNQSEKRFVTRLMKNSQKLIQLNPINSEKSIRNQIFNPDQSELGLIWIGNLVSDWFGYRNESE